MPTRSLRGSVILPLCPSNRTEGRPVQMTQSVSKRTTIFRRDPDAPPNQPGLGNRPAGVEETITQTATMRHPDTGEALVSLRWPPDIAGAR